MTRQRLILLAAGGSAALLAGAFVFQALGYAPCKLCLWQRWPHAAAILVGMVAYYTQVYWLAWLGALAALTTAGIGAYHTGVERGWWQGPTSCTGAGNDLSGMSGADLLSTQIADTIIMCDEVAWDLFGISMASWNMVFSLGFALLWVITARRA